MYGTTNSILLQRVQKIENFAAKVCAGGARTSDHTTSLITQPAWLKIEEKVIFNVAANVFKIKADWFMQLPTKIKSRKIGTPHYNQPLGISHQN